MQETGYENWQLHMIMKIVYHKFNVLLFQHIKTPNMKGPLVSKPWF